MSTSTTKPAIDNLSGWTTSCSSEATQRREHRNNWIAFIIIIVFSLVALCVAILMIVISQKGNVITHLEAKIYNVQFHRSMKNRTSKKFRNVSRPFCNEINKYFQSSHLSKIYRNCVVDRLRRGEKTNTTVEFRILFKNSETFVHPNQVRDVILAKAGRHKRNNYYYLRIGRFLILYKSLRIFLIRTSSTVPDILVRSKENGVDPEPNSVENEADEYADDGPLTTRTYETSRSLASENYPSTAEDERTNSVTLREISTASSYGSISSPNIPAASKGSSNVNSPKRKGSKFSSNRTSNGTNATVGSSRHANNFTFSNKTISSFNSSSQIRNSSVAVKYVGTYEHPHKSDNLRPLNVGGESTASAQLETPTISRVHVNGGTESESKFILAGTTVAFLASPLSSTSRLMAKLTTAKSDNDRNITTYNRASDNRASDEATTEGAVENTLSIGNHTSESENETFVLFSRNAAYQNKTELVNDNADIYNQTSYDRSESVANRTERLCAKTSHTEKDFTISSTESWEQHGDSTAGEVERLWHSKILSRNGQQQVNNSQFNVSFSNENITWYREINENSRMGDNTAVSIEYDSGEEQTGGTERITEVQNDRIDSINYDIQLHSPETSLNFEVNDTFSHLDDKDILSSINSTTVYNTSNNSPSNGHVKHNVSSRFDVNGYLTSSRLYTGIRESSETIGYYNGNLSHYYNGSTNNGGNNSSLSFIDGVYIQSPRQYNDNRSSENTTNMKPNSSFYTDKLGNATNSGSLSAAVTLEHYNKTTDISFNTESIGNNNESNVFSRKYNDRLLSFEGAEHFNGTSSGAVVTRQFNRISNDSWYMEYFNNTQERIVDMSFDFESNNRNNDTVYSFSQTDDRILADLDVIDNFNDTTAGNEDRKTYKVSLRGNRELNYQTVFSAITTTTRYDGIASVFVDTEGYKGSVSSTKSKGRKDTLLMKETKLYNDTVTGTDGLEQLREDIEIRNQTLSHVLSSGHHGTRPVSQNIEHNNDSLSYTGDTGHYKETLFDSVGSKVYNSTLSRVTSLHKITVFSDDSTNHYRNISDIRKDSSHKSFLSTFSLEDEQNNQSVGHRERLSLNERPNRTLTTFTPTSTVQINSGISEWSRQNSILLFLKNQTGTPSTAEFETNETLNLWTNSIFSNIDNDNLTFPSTEAPILQNKSDTFFDSLRVKADSDISQFHPGSSLKSSNNRADFKYVSVERNQTQVASTTTLNPIKDAAITEKIDQITTNRTISNETTMPKRIRPLLEITKIKSRVNIKPSRSGWLAVRVDYTSRYFGRARKRKGGARTHSPHTTTSSEDDIGFVAREQGVDVTNLGIKNRIQRESSTVALLKGAFLTTNVSKRIVVVTPGKSANVISDAKAITADVTHSHQLPWNQPTTESSNPRLRIDLDLLSLNSRFVNPVNNHTKSRQVLEEDTQIEKTAFRKEDPSIHEQFYSGSKEENEQGFKEFLLKTTSSYEINDTSITEGSGEILTNIRKPFAAVFRQNVSWAESNVQLNSIQSTSSNIVDTLTDLRLDINNQLVMDGSTDFDANDTLNSFGNDQLTYNNVNSTDYYETTNFPDSDFRPSASPILPTPVTTPSENITVVDSTSHEHADDSVETHKSIKELSELTPIISAVRPTIRFENSSSSRNSVLSSTTPIITTADSSLNNVIFSASLNDERKYINTILNVTETIVNKRNNSRQNNTIDNVESSGDIISGSEDPLFEAYNLTSNNFDRNDSRQSRIETSTSIHNKQQTFAVSLTDENLRNTTTGDSIDNRLSKQTATFKNLVLNINGFIAMTSVSGKPKTDSRNKLSDPVPTKTGHETTTAVSISRPTSPLLRLFVLEGKSFHNSSLKARTLTEAVLNRSSGVSSKLAALASPKKLLGNGTKDLIGVTVIINIKSAGSGWVKIPINKTSSSKGVEIGVHRTSTTSTASKPFTNTSIVNTLLEPSLATEATLISTNIARWKSITPAFNIYPVASENSDVIKRILMPTPASQTALTNASFAAAKGLHLANGYFQATNAPALNAPTSVTGTKQNGASTEEENSTMKRDFTSIAGTESTSKLQTAWPASESSTAFRILKSESGLSANVQELGQAVTVPRVTSGLSTKQATTKTATSPSTSATFSTTTSPSIITTLPKTTTMSSLPLTTTTLPPTTTLPATLPLTTTSQTSTVTTLETTLSSTTTMPPTTTTLATTLPLTTTLLPPTTTLATTTAPPTTSTRTMTTLSPTTNAKLTTIPPLTTNTLTLLPPSTTTTTLSFATLPPTTKITTLPTTILRATTTTQLTNPVLTTTIPPPPATSTLPPTTIASTTPTTSIPKTTFPRTTTILRTQPLTTQISIFSSTSTSTTAPPPTTKTTTTMTPSQTSMPVTSTAIQRLPVNTTLTSSSTIIIAQTTSSTVTFAPAAFSSSAGPTSTTPAPTTTTTNPTTTEITVLNLTSVSGALYEPASVICTLIGPKIWTRIDLLLDQPTMNRSKVLATFKRASLSSETENYSHSASLVIRGQMSRAKLIIEKFQCDDQGLYACRVDNDQLEEKVNVYAKILTPDLPKIEMNDFVEHRTTKVSCTGIVPFPNGDLDWKLNGRILRRNTKMKVDTTVGNCTKLLTKTFVGRFGRRLNGSELTCFETGSPQRFTSIKVQIVPSNFCEGRPIDKVYSHPYTCNKYITCLDGYFLTSYCPDTLCYNAERDRCEEENEPTDPTSITAEDMFSCIGKPTGQAVPNPDECTGYYLCVAGLKNIRRCPSDTYFTLTITGFCTFDYKQSYCASIGKKLPTR